MSSSGSSSRLSAILLFLCLPILTTTHFLFPYPLLPIPSLVNFLFLIAGASMIPISKRLLQNFRGESFQEGKDVIYGLDHGRLNLQFPVKNMWMNMGYWKETHHFPTACKALLHEVLNTAKIPLGQQIRLLDLGFGCGDQTIELLVLGTRIEGDSCHRAINSWLPGTRLLIEKYVGITLNTTQFKCAYTRLLKLLAKSSRLQIFCADAAKPESWKPELHDELECLYPYLPQENSVPQIHSSTEDWVLALDTMYHFSPSRRPILTYAHRKLNASLMAFDLLLHDQATWWERILLSILAKLTGCPLGAFMTELEYRELLVQIGYAADNIEIRDISEFCFAPLARFLEERERDMNQIGLGMGGFSVAKRMFGWWGRSGIVRGVIIIARSQGR